MAQLTDKAKDFLAQKPTKIGTVAGYRFYEHPEYGDEAPLVCITPDGRKVNSMFWELPTIDELFA